MLLLSKVTAAVSAIARPQRILADVFAVTLALAMRLPKKTELVPKVAELPTCQYTPPPGLPLTMDI